MLAACTTVETAETQSRSSTTAAAKTADAESAKKSTAGKSKKAKKKRKLYCRRAGHTLGSRRRVGDGRRCVDPNQDQDEARNAKNSVRRFEETRGTLIERETGFGDN